MATRILSVTSRIIPGLIVLAAGVILLLNNLDIIRIQGIRRFWPLLLVAYGLSQVAGSSRKSRGVGIGLLVIGTFFQLANLGLISNRIIRDLWRLWPIILIVVGIRELLVRNRPPNLTGGLILLALGAYFQLRMFDLIHLSLWQLWPVALILIGIGMVHKALQGRRWSR